jgi:hypothetical protein
MLLSVRESAEVLAVAGLTFDQTRLLLRTGVAGPGTPVAGSVAYDEDAVLALACRPERVPQDVTRLVAAGLYVARLSRDVRVDLGAPWAEVAESLSDQPSLTPMSRALLAARIAGHGRLPWVATLFGFVLLGADTVGVWSDDSRGRTVFALEPPGAWFSAVDGSRLRTRRGRPGLLLTRLGDHCEEGVDRPLPRSAPGTTARGTSSG